MRSRVALAVAATALLYGAFIALQLSRVGGDISRFVVAGDEFCAHVPGVTIGHDAGYDGQFYLRLALSPTSSTRVANGIRFDYPAYRAQRIVYPLIVKMLSFGSLRATLWLLVLVNLAAVCAIAGFGARLLELHRIDGLYAIALALWPGFLLTIRRDLTECVELAFIVAALLAIARSRYALAAVILTFAALTKEPALFVAGAALVSRRLVFALPPAVYIGWKFLLFHAFRLPVNFNSGGVFVAPFATVVPRFLHAEPLLKIEIALLGTFALLVVVAMFRSRADFDVKLATLAYLALVTMLGPLFWDDDWSFLRASSELGVLGAFIAITSAPAMRRIVAAMLAASWLALAWHVLFYR